MKITLAFQTQLGKNASLRNKIETQLIKWYTRSKYFHVETIIGDDYISSGPSHGGAFRTPLHDLTEKYEYVKIDVDGRKMKKVQKFIDSQLGTGYDWAGIFFGQLLKTDIDDHSKWFCSELVAEILKMLGEDLDLPSHRFSPKDLADIYMK